MGNFTRFIGEVSVGAICGTSPITTFRKDPDGPGVIEETMTLEEYERRRDEYAKAHPEQGGLVMVDRDTP